jgi:hypothetical protein
VNSLIRPHHESRRPDQGSGRRHRRAPDVERPRRHFIPLTPEGVPAATPDAPKPSPVVLVAEDARARYPWLPARVIAGSVWSGPAHERVRVAENGEASPWPRGQRSATPRRTELDRWTAGLRR